MGAPYFETLLEKLMLMGWVKRTHIQDGPEGENSTINIQFTADGLIKFLSVAPLLLLQEISDSGHALSAEEIKAFSGLPILAQAQARKSRQLPPNPRF